MSIAAQQPAVNLNAADTKLLLPLYSIPDRFTVCYRMRTEVSFVCVQQSHAIAAMGVLTQL